MSSSPYRADRYHRQLPPVAFIEEVKAQEHIDNHDHFFSHIKTCDHEVLNECRAL